MNHFPVQIFFLYHKNINEIKNFLILMCFFFHGILGFIKNLEFEIAFSEKSNI